MLLDSMRNPELLKQMTDSVLRVREDQFREKIKGRVSF